MHHRPNLWFNDCQKQRYSKVRLINILVPINMNCDINLKTNKSNTDNNRYKRTRRLIKNLRTNALEPEKKTVLPRKQNHQKSSNKIFITLVVSLIAYLCYFLMKSNIFLIVDERQQLANIKEDFATLVYGQQLPLEIITRVLENKSNWEQKTEIISLVGTQGVGKTFISNILSNNFHPSVTHRIFGQDLGNDVKEMSIVKKINPCCCNLLIIDDLKWDDCDLVHNLVKGLPGDTFILVVAIFNIQDTDDGVNFMVNHEALNIIRRSFGESNTALFETFNRSSLEDYANNILLSKGIRHQCNLDEIQHDVVQQGFKGLYSKIVMQFL